MQRFLIGALVIACVGCAPLPNRSQEEQIGVLQHRIAALEAAVSERNAAEPLVAPRCGAIVCDVAALDLVTHASRYDGQRIGLTVFYATNFEMSALFPAADLVDPHQGIWLESGLPCKCSGHRVYVMGTFHAGPSGHLGEYIGSLSDITFARDLEAPDSTLPHSPAR